MKKSDNKRLDYYLGISERARKIFDSIADNFPDDIKVELDFATLSIFADSVVRLEKLNSEIGERNLWYKTDRGTFAPHPARDEKSMLQKQIHYCAAKLGLTPDARNKIKLDLAEIVKSETGTGRKKQKRAKTAEEMAEEFC